MTIVHAVVERHARTAAFLWGVRDRAACSPRHAAADLARLDERIEAHLDGLREAGDEGFAICATELENEGPGEVFAAASPAFGSGDRRRIGAVLARVIATPATARGLVSALGWLALEAAAPHLDELLDARSPVLALAGVAGSAVHRRAPGSWLGRALSAADTRVRARALRAVGELGRTELVPTLVQSLSYEDAEGRFWAAWSAGLFGEQEAIGHLREEVIAAGPHAEAALSVAAARLPLPDAHAMQRALATREETRRLAVLAAGAIGDAAAVPWLVEQLKRADVARTAGEAIVRITGVDVEKVGLMGAAPEGFGAGTTDGVEDTDPEEGLPWLDAAAVERWWGGRRAELRPGARRLLGEAIAPGHLEKVIATGGQRMRAAAAVELCVIDPARGVANVAVRTKVADTSGV